VAEEENQGEPSVPWNRSKATTERVGQVRRIGTNNELPLPQTRLFLTVFVFPDGSAKTVRNDIRLLSANENRQEWSIYFLSVCKTHSNTCAHRYLSSSIASDPAARGRLSQRRASPSARRRVHAGDRSDETTSRRHSSGRAPT
jgi:hypothetical protein